jgi:hypothetical protein
MIKIENKVDLIKIQNLLARTWRIQYKGETYLYTAYSQEDGRLVNDHIQDNYGYDVNDETLKEDIFDYWNSQQ